MSNTSFGELTTQALADNPPYRGKNSARRSAILQRENLETRHIVDGLSLIQRNFTVVSAYLQAPDKNPSAFIQKLESLFEAKILVSKRPKTILNQLNKAWEKCVKADAQIPFNPSAPHVFLGVIHQLPELWNAELSFGNVPQTLFLPPARLSYDA